MSLRARALVGADRADERARRAFAADLGSRLSLASALEELESLRPLRLAVVGETIIDEYAYCDAIGKSGKEPMLVTRFQACEQQAGGVLAIANHLAELCDRVELVSALGTVEPREGFVRDSLAAGVEPHLTRKTGAPTIVKRRYVDAYSLAKMFGVYHIDDSLLAGADEDAFLEALEQVVPACDAVAVADYGHGLLTPRAVRYLSEHARLLVVNAQINAANTGYHTVSKYPRADCACLHEGELRMDARDLHGPLAPLIEDLARRLGARYVMVTRGKSGTVLYARGAGLIACPSFATRVLERVGAGDAVLAVTTAALAGDLDPALVVLLGNLAGAQAVTVMGNRCSIRKSAMIEQLRSIWPARAARVASAV
jgi:bifunctional ADP-heptose synthase (sugar kinase/adenylyltransferase)